MTQDYTKDPTYCELVKLVLSSEGGYVDNPNDPGGPTKYGIAWNYNREILREMGVKDVHDLTLEQAREIYYHKYWLACHADTIPDKRLAYIHFDTAVNHGVGQSTVFLKRLSHDPSSFEGHGKNNALWLGLCLEYVMHRQRFYTRAKNRKVFLEGWMNRLSDVVDNALKMKD